MIKLFVRFPSLKNQLQLKFIATYRQNMCYHSLNSRLSTTSYFPAGRCTPHWGLAVRQFLNDTFPDKWIGRHGPILWPPRSPDITPLDFFLWGYAKDIVY